MAMLFKKKTLMHLGLMLGADVPVFIHGYSSFSEGLGEKLISITIPKRWYLIIMPSVNVSTRHIFNVFELFNNYSPYRSIKNLLNMPFSNDLEPIVKKIFPEIAIYFEYLSQYTLARLTGTGSCIFSEFCNEQIACQVQKCLPSWMKSVVVKGIQISPLHQMLSKHDTITL